MADFNPWSSDEDDEAEVFQDEEDLHVHRIVLVDCRPCMFVPNPHDEEAEASSGSTYFTSVMDIVLDMFKETIISRPKDKLALVFFGTRERRHTEFDHVWVAQKLEHPEADVIKRVQMMRGWGVADFERAVGSLRAGDRTLPSGAAALKSAIWECNVTFNNDSKRTADENIWIFTNDDDPCHAGAGADARDREVELLREQAKEAAEVNRKITLVPMTPPPPAADFTLSKVYAPALLAQHCAADKGERASHIALKSATRRKHVRKRTTASLPFVVHGGARFRVRTYKVLQRAKRPAHVDVDAHDSTVLLKVLILTSDLSVCYLPTTTHSLLVSTPTSSTGYLIRAFKTSTPMCEATGANLEPAQIKTYVPYAQQRVYVRRADVAAAKDIGERGIVLLGFARESELRDYSMDSSVFVYPDECAVAGSTAAFAALHAAMRREDREGGRRFALVAFRPREASAPQLAALVATPNQGSVGGGVGGGGGGGGSSSKALLPGGMHLIKLPYRNEIRDLSRAVGPHHAFLATSAERRAALARAEAEAEAAAGGGGCEELGEEARAAAVARAGWRPDDATVAAARKVLVCRMPSYDPSNFPNPSLNKFYAHLQAHSLEEDAPNFDEEEDDVTMISEQLLAMIEKKQKRFDAFAETLAHVPEEDPAAAAAGKGKKRAGSGGSSGGGASKRAKTVAPEEVSALPWLQMMREGALGKQTAATLKAYCAHVGLVKGGRKDELVERITDHLYADEMAALTEGGLSGGKAAAASGGDAEGGVKREEWWNEEPRSKPRYVAGGGGGPNANNTLNHDDFRLREDAAAAARAPLSAKPELPSPVAPPPPAHCSPQPPLPKARNPWSDSDDSD